MFNNALGSANVTRQRAGKTSVQLNLGKYHEKYCKLYEMLDVQLKRVSVRNK